MYKFKSANDLAKTLEYTNLDNTATKDDMVEFFNKASEFDFNSVIVSPSYITLAKEKLKDTDTKIGTVIAFPLGFETTEMKVENAKIAMDLGVDSIDMMLNLSDLKSNNYEAIEKEVKAVKEAIGDKVLKVIIESKQLVDDEKAKIAKLLEKSGVDYIKTSTGFNGINNFYENIHDINILKKNAPKTKIKAAGGISEYKDAYRILSSGVTTIGSSSAYEIIKSFETLVNNEDVKQEMLKV
ncbi:deoxyribose-phosphate aldolase [Methanobrevibacter sp. DSM 116169]|uniref:deoxyribose-phosphate aldolase n=1 Tax=Methanobrevibacter sp. DSM 116169 TaxID=3242727 RepID=UPI0038FCF86A